MPSAATPWDAEGGREEQKKRQPSLDVWEKAMGSERSVEAGKRGAKRHEVRWWPGGAYLRPEFPLLVLAGVPRARGPTLQLPLALIAGSRARFS